MKLHIRNYSCVKYESFLKVSKRAVGQKAVVISKNKYNILYQNLTK